MYPAAGFVEDFVGADRALKRLALQRVRDIDLWKAPLVRVGEPRGRGAGEGRGLRPPLPAAHRRRRPAARLAVGARAAGRAGEDELRSRAEPVVELDDVLRDALSDLLADETQYGPVVDERGDVAGVLSIEVLGHALKTHPDQVPRGADALDDDPRRSPRSRSTTARRTRCVAEQRALPRLDRRQLRPLRRPVLPARLPDGRLAGDRVRDLLRAGAASPTAGAGWSPRSPRSPGSSTRSRAWRPSSCCCRSPGAATTRRSSRSWPTRC